MKTEDIRKNKNTIYRSKTKFDYRPRVYYRRFYGALYTNVLVSKAVFRQYYRLCKRYRYYIRFANSKNKVSEHIHTYQI